MLWTTIAMAVAVLLASVAFRTTQQTTSDETQTEISFTGLIANPATLSLDDVMAMPSVTLKAELICVSGQSLGVHNWTGVRLSYLLNMTGVQDGAVKVAFHAADGYETDLTIADASRPDVIVAYLEDGAPMGEITRLVVPGMWGYKWISNIDTINVVDYDFIGTWESNGYPDDAAVRRS